MALPKKINEKEIDTLFERFFEEPFKNLMRNRFPVFEEFAKFEDLTPKVDMFDSKNELVVKMEVPGIDKKNINISISDGMLNVQGEVKKEEETKKDDYYYSERSYGSFSRRLRLPVDVKEDLVKATYKDGVLEIKLPKTAKSKPKEIKVQIK